MATRGGYGKRLCVRLNVPWTLHNRRAFATWMQSEGGSARNNPLNTTQRMPGSTSYNYVGVQNYPNLDSGLAATTRTFHTQGQGYDRILAAMRRNDPARKTVRIIGETNWGTGKTLMAQVLTWIAHFSPILRYLERKEVAS